MDSKHPLRSKTVWANLILLALAIFAPGSEECFSKVTSGPLVLGGLAVMNIVLRFATSKKILFCLAGLVLMGCASVPQELETEKFYRRDVEIKYDGQSYDGVAVLPYERWYDLEFSTPGDVDLALVRSCHREVEFRDKRRKRFGPR